MKLYNLTNPQKSIWITEEFYKNTSINNVVGRVQFLQKMNIEILKKALNIIIEQNNSLRTRIVLKNNIAYQYFEDFNTVNIQEIFIKNESSKKSIIEELAKKRFSLIESDLMKFYILKYENGYADILFVAHHLIADAWTISLYAQKTMEIYNKLQNKEIIDMTNISYTDYITAEEEYLNSDKFNKDKEYWNNVFISEPNSKFFNSNSIKDVEGKRQHYTIEKDFADTIKAYSKSNNVSVQCFFMSLYATYLSKIASNNKITIGMPILNRTNFKQKNTMGMFINTIPFNININKNNTFIGLLKNVSNEQYKMLRHYSYPYEILQEDLKNKFGTIQKLYSVAFSFQNAKLDNLYDMKYITSWEFNGCCADDLQIHISDIENTGTFNIYYDYKLDVLDDLEVSNIHKRVINMIERIFADKQEKIQNIEIITKDEKEKITNEFNNTVLEYPRELNINNIIKNISLKFPNNIAVKDYKRELTYYELDIQSNRVANALKKRGIKKGEIVSILLKEKNINLIISILGILKVGATFLSIYANLPKDRIDYILSDSNTKLLINDNNISKCSNINKLDITELENENNFNDVNVGVNDTAYIIYTSGSTGMPKGVQLSHKNLINFVYSFKDRLHNNVSSEDRFLSITNISFDVSISEIFTSLLFGATLYLYKDISYSNPKELSQFIVNNNITFAYLPPALLNDMIKELNNYNNVKLDKLLVGVEPIKTNTLKEFLKINPNMKIINGYGPTETTICSTMYDFNSNEVDSAIVSIGKPLGNTKIHIYNNDMNIMPINTAGEIYISGEGVGKGYINNKKLTTERFIMHNGVIMYKTGDLGKWLQNGNITFIGRYDNQVKYRGYRIDLGEIENTLKKHIEIKNAIVILDKENFKTEQLLCFVSLNDNKVLIEELREFLSKSLPYYMIPSCFITIDKVPMTSNGKVDKKELLQIAIKSKQNKKNNPAKTNTQIKILNVLQKELNLKDINIDDNFFDLGIDSLEAMKLVVHLAENNVNVSTQDFYNYPNIELLSNKIDNINTTSAERQESYIREIDNLKKEQLTIDGNVLLLGATGFLGIHLLKELLENTSVKVYCLIRADSDNHSLKRLKEKINFYFDNSFYNLYKGRIIAVSGDFTLNNLGLSIERYELVKNDISMIINSAACVKHYGNSQYFHNINYLSVKRIINMCKMSNNKIQLVQISTLSVLNANKNEKNSISEEDMYINQELENVYIKTKFEAEQLIAQEMKNGLKATIFRLGNIMWRSNDGKFQINENENAFLNKIKAIINTKIVSEELLNITVDISPVNSCSNAIIKLLLNNQLNIYHIVNTKYIKLKDLINIFNNIGYKIDSLSKNEYKKQIKTAMTEKNNLILFVENSLYSSNTINSQKTAQLLQELNFKWNAIDVSYISKFFKTNN